MSSKEFRKFTSVIMIQTLKNVQWAVARLPRRFVQFWVRGLFAVAYLFMKSLKQISVRNLQAVYGNSRSENDFKVMTKMCIKNVGYSMMDMLYFVDRPKELLAVTTVHHEERLQEALKKGKGAVMITAHLGNFPLMFETLIQKGYKVNVIIRPMRDPQFGKFMHAECAKWNIKMIELDPPKEFFRQSLSALKRNELLFILLDEVAPSGQGVTVDFFNKKVERAVGPMLFHERVGSPILPAFIVKNEEEKFEIFIEEEIKVENNATEELNKIKTISKLTEVIESYVKHYPLQWGGWLNKRWN